MFKSMVVHDCASLPTNRPDGSHGASIWWYIHRAAEFALTRNASREQHMTQPPATDEPLTPEHIMQVGLGFWASKTLLSAVELE